jgi:oxygen-dependent protoporphyrinogen oxidase
MTVAHTGVGAGNRRRVAVVGAGISGLTAALRLDLLGYDVELVEADKVLGGRFGLDKLGDRQVMTGGKNIGRRYHTFRWFTSELGADAYDSFGYNASRIKDGEILTLDSERRSQTLKNIRRMGSARDFARMAAMAARIRADERNRFLGSRYFSGVSRRHDHAALSSFFGREMTDMLVRPMVIRNNGAEPDEVYPGTFGTNLSMLMDHYDQLSGGIQPVLEAFAKRVPVRLGATVEGLEVRDGKVTGLRVSEDGAPTRTLDYDGVVLATGLRDRRDPALRAPRSRPAPLGRELLPVHRGARRVRPAHVRPRRARARHGRRAVQQRRFVRHGGAAHRPLHLQRTRGAADRPQSWEHRPADR